MRIFLPLSGAAQLHQLSEAAGEAAEASAQNGDARGGDGVV